MRITATVRTDSSGQIAANIQAQLRRVLAAYAHRVEAKAKASIMAGDKSGRVYARGNGRSHTASAPGQAPATDTGILVNSITAFQTGPLQWTVAASAEYAVYLEMGTIRMAPRPFLGPALESQRSAFEAAVLRTG